MKLWFQHFVAYRRLIDGGRAKCRNYSFIQAVDTTICSSIDVIIFVVIIIILLFTIAYQDCRILVLHDKMTEELFWQDHLTIGLYVAVVLVVGMWSTCRPNRGSVSGYFLAGKSMNWIMIGASVYASQMGAPVFIGLTGTAAASGFAVAIYEWHAVFLLILLGWVFVPVYVACGTYTMPEYLKKRFGGKRIHIYASIVALVSYVQNNIAAEIYSGALFMQLLLGWNMYVCVGLILAVTCLFTITGGLAAVIYTDALQTIILLMGCIVVAFMSFDAVGGWGGMVAKYPYAAANYTLYNQTYYQCGMPREDAFHIWRDATTGDIPWPGAVFGLTTLGLFNWCNDQIIVQRCLSGKHIGHAKAGSLLAAFLKMFGFFLFLTPGMISRILYPEDVACADPDKCESVCGNRAGCTNIAYPLLVLRMLPSGLRGLMLAAFLAALMSSLTSIFNSASTVVTMDVWRQIRKRAGNSELMVVGRLTVLVLAGLSILWLPVIQTAGGGVLWFYLQAARSYVVPHWCMVFVLGVFWKGLTEQGAFWGLIVGLVIGFVRMVMDFSIPAPLCGSQEPDNRLEIVSKVDFLHFAIILAGVSTICMVIISLFTKPRSEAQLHRVTWWTRNDEEEPGLGDDEINDETENKVQKIQEESMELTRDSDEPCKHDLSYLDADDPNRQRYCQCLRDWVCGTVAKEERKMTKEEKIAVRKTMTSISEPIIFKKIVNVVAIFLSIVTIFFLVFLG